jgi:protocatechuate 3,4-dioxygenase beta subunit
VTLKNANPVKKTQKRNRLAPHNRNEKFEDKVAAPAALLREDAVQDGFGMMGPMGPMMMMARQTNPVFSGPDGRFSMSIAADRDVEIRAAKKGYPDSKSSVLKLVPGEKKSNVLITVPRGLAVTGRVIDGNGRPLSGAKVTASEASGDPGMMIRRQIAIGGPRNEEPVVESGSDGTFTMNLKEGSYDLVFKREGYAGKSVRAHRVARDSEPLEVTLAPGAEITGRVTRAGNGIEGVRVFAFSQLIGDSNASTDALGYFTLSDLAPGSYMVAFNKPEEGIRENRNATAPTRDLVVELPQGGRITGRVIDKATRKPVTAFQAGVTMSRSGGGMVIAMPPAMREFTSDDGTFTLENVAPGSAEVNVTAPGYVRGRASGLTVEDGKTLADIEVSLDTGARLTGRVTDSAGSAVADARVSVATSGRNPAAAMMRGAGSSATTDGNGDYVLESVEAGSIELVAEHQQYVTSRKTVEVSGKEARADFRLDSGLRVAGQVVDENGAPVAEAFVNSNSAAGTGSNRSTRTDANGNFSFESLPAGRYTFNANHSGYANGVVRDVDIATSGALKITLAAGAVIYGHVTGLSEAELATASVNASGSGTRASAPVDSTGSFRITGAPTGSVNVSAMAGGFSGNKSSGVKNVQVETGGSVQVDLEFRSDVAISGRVTRGGAPVSNMRVIFIPDGGSARTNGSATTDDAGNYTVSGLEDGHYSVNVMDMQRFTPFNTKFDVNGSGHFDIEIPSSQLRGRVIDVATGQGLDGVQVELRTSTSDRFGGRSATTTSTGAFTFDSVAEGTYRVVTEKTGYASGNADAVVTSSGGDVEVRMSKADGANIRLVDARDQRGLTGRIYVTDMQDRYVMDDGVRTDGTESQKLSLPAGQYIGRAWASGYASRTVVLNAPGNLNIGLTPGGSIEITSSTSTPREARLIDEAGRIYYLFGRMPRFSVDGGTSTLRNIAPGGYTLQIMDGAGAVTASKQVTVGEAQTVRVSI